MAIAPAVEVPAVEVKIEEAPLPAIAWQAIVAGGLAAAALSLFLLALGSGIGLSVVSPWAHSSVTSSHAALIAGLYLVLTAIMSSGVGGYLAGRLRHRWIGTTGDEVYFRDTAHGFLAWAFATVLSAIALASAGPAMIGMPGLGITDGGRTLTHGFDVAPYVDRLLRPDLNALSAQGAAAAANSTPAPATPATTPSDQAAGTTPPASATAPAPTEVVPSVSPQNAQLGTQVLTAAGIASTRASLARMLLASLSNTNPRDADGLTVDDRTYMAQLVTAYSGLKPPQADRRVSDVTSMMRQAVDNARKTARNLALWLSASLLFGAFAASLAALEGGGLRDGRLRYGPMHRIEPVKVA